MKKTFLAAMTVGLLVLSAGAYADEPGKHPYYLHALSDLRTAHWLLEHRQGDARVSRHENLALAQIDAAVNDIRHAAIDDGKNVQARTADDAGADHPGRLHKAVELLEKVHADVAREEDDPRSRGLQHRAIRHVDAALNQVKRAIVDVENHR